MSDDNSKTLEEAAKKYAREWFGEMFFDEGARRNEAERTTLNIDQINAQRDKLYNNMVNFLAATIRDRTGVKEKQVPVAVHPGEYIKDEIDERGHEFEVLRRKSKLSAQTVESLIAGTQAVTPQIAASLAAILGTSERVWLRLQDVYDAQIIHDCTGAKMKVYDCPTCDDTGQCRGCGTEGCEYCNGRGRCRDCNGRPHTPPPDLPVLLKMMEWSWPEEWKGPFEVINETISFTNGAWYARVVSGGASGRLIAKFDSRLGGSFQADYLCALLNSAWQRSQEEKK